MQTLDTEAGFTGSSGSIACCRKRESRNPAAKSDEKPLSAELSKFELVSGSDESQLPQKGSRLLLRTSTIRVILAVFLTEGRPTKDAERWNKESAHIGKDTWSWQGP